MSVYSGVDVSQFQGVINWASVASAKSFAIIKASGGDAGLYTDSKLGTNQTNARANGLKTGYYHFGSLGLNNAVTEANYFTTAVGTLNSGEILVLDAESEAGAGITLSQSSVAWCKAFLDQVATTVGFKPMIYMSQYPAYSIDWSSVANAGYPLWVADYAVLSSNSNLNVGAWTNGGYGYPILQYSSSGSVSGISGSVDLDSFFVPAGGTLSSWDNYGKGGSSTVAGSTNTAAIVTNPLAGTVQTAGGTATTFFTQAAPQTIIAPTEVYDQVIYSVVTTDATLTTGSHNAFYEIPTPVNQYAYPIGIFSYDGGASYNDFGFTLPAATTYASVQPGVQIQPAVDASGNIFFNGVNNTGGTVSLTIKIALLASYSPGVVPLPATLSQKVSYTNYNTPLPDQQALYQYLPPYSTYRRISADSHTGTGASITVAHGQSSVPNIMFWVKVGGFVTLNAGGWASTGSLGVLGVKMDSTNLNFHVDGGTYQDLFYRIYKDNA